jgi:S1-C subfamily serine protease
MCRLFASLVALSVLPAGVRADDAIPVKTLTDLKAATVFVKCQFPRGSGTGSGFLMKVEDTTGYLVTNHHVIALGPNQPATKISVVFHSGRKNELVVDAELLASDASRDLAILRVAKVKDLPKPIDLAAKVELRETMSVYVVGFPLGEVLSTTKGNNPAVTIGKGTVSSIREKDGEVSVVQLDGDLNPGNSGGPVVDGTGALVGVAVAKIRNTRIGFAIPPLELTRMLNGRVGEIGIHLGTVNEGKAEVQVSLRMIDPLDKIRSATIHYIRVEKGADKPKPQADGTWAVLPGAEKAELKLEKQQGTSKLMLTSTEKVPVNYLFQPSFVNGAGKTIFAQPISYALDFGKTTTGPGPLPLGKVPDPKTSKDSQVNEIRTVGDLTVFDLKLEANKSPRCLCWSDDAKSFYHLNTENGIIRKIGVADLTEEVRLETGRVCGWLAVSAEGLIATLPAQQEAWLLDAQTLKVKKKIAVPSPTRVVSSPRLSVAFSTNRGESISVIDLKAGKIVKEYTPRDFQGKGGFSGPVVSPDGKYLLTTGGIEQLHRFKIDREELQYEQSSPRIIQGRFEGIDVSIDSAHVAAPSGGGNYGGNKDHPEVGPYHTFIYPITDLHKPAVAIKQGAYPLAIGVDNKAGLIYAHNFEFQFIVFTDGGLKQKEHKLGQGGVRQFLVHPNGRKVLVLGDSQMWCVELPKP